MEYPCGICCQYANKPLHDFNTDILTYTHRVTPPDIQLKSPSFHLLNYFGHMLEVITIRHINLFLFLLIHLFTRYNLSLTQFGFWGNGQKNINLEHLDVHIVPRLRSCSHKR